VGLSAHCSNIKIYDNRGLEDFEKKECRLPVEGGDPVEAVTQEVRTVEAAASAKTIKPRALILKATNKDFDRVTELIKSEFPEVEILYITTGPVASVLRVTKSLPFEMQNASEQSLYTIE
jgi:hypothetical protein